MLKVKSMAFDKLVKERAQIDAEIELRTASERASLLQALSNIRGLSSSRAGNGGRPHALKGRKLPPLYRNPKNRAETWAGPGNRPRWLRAAMRQGKKLESFAK